MQDKNTIPLMTLNDAATLLHVSPWTLRQWDRKGILKAIRIGTRKDRRYQKEEILKFIKKSSS